jgi:hypothetical protein
MKKTILITIITLLTLTVKSQDYWRTLTLSTIAGTNGVDRFNTVSASLHYDLKNKFFVSNWTGLQIQRTGEINSWFSTQTTINKYIGKWNVGIGHQYGLFSIPNSRILKNNSSYFVSSVSYRFKLR